jgi:hypothetical protein
MHLVGESSPDIAVRMRVTPATVYSVLKMMEALVTGTEAEEDPLTRAQSLRDVEIGERRDIIEAIMDERDCETGFYTMNSARDLKKRLRESHSTVASLRTIHR